jgi:hypothetical protein
MQENGAALFGREAWTYNAAPGRETEKRHFSGSVGRFAYKRF